MPNIHGLLSIVSLLFAPFAELRYVFFLQSENKVTK